MSRKGDTRTVLVVCAVCLTCAGAWYAFRPAARSVADGNGVTHAEAGPAWAADSLERRFANEVRPFLERYCLSCHGPAKHKAYLDLSTDLTSAAAADNDPRWKRV